MSESPPTPEVPMLQGHEAHYVRTQEYSSVPKYQGSGTSSAAAFLAKNGLENEDGVVVVDGKLFSSTSHAYAEGEFVCPGFFSIAHLDGFTRRYLYDQWTYEMRRETQSIFPFLFLGPSSCCRDLEFLKRQGITLLLAIRNRHSAWARLVSGEKAAAEIGVQADTIDVLDSQELVSVLPRSIRRINDHLAGVDVDTAANPGAPQANGYPHKRKILVFCESGNERSAVVVIAYIMVMLNLDVIQATKMVQQRRFCINIEEPMRRILAAFDSILSAKRDVERARRTPIQTGAATLAPPPMPPVLLSKKRSFANRQQDDDDTDVDMADGNMEVDGDDDFHFERKPQAPFQDREA